MLCYLTASDAMPQTITGNTRTRTADTADTADCLHHILEANGEHAK